jgi:hypothetical protein
VVSSAGMPRVLAVFAIPTTLLLASSGGMSSMSCISPT